MSSPIDDGGGPAFARAGCQWTEDHGDGAWSQTGMSLRDYFAGQALIGITVSLTRGIRPIDLLTMAGDCYLIADALIAARTKGR
jgi:hypothetical protein